MPPVPVRRREDAQHVLQGATDQAKAAPVLNSPHFLLMTLACGNGGGNYDCGTGRYKTGNQCNGRGTTDTQTCAGMKLGAASNAKCVRMEERLIVVLLAFTRQEALAVETPSQTLKLAKVPFTYLPLLLPTASPTPCLSQLPSACGNGGTSYTCPASTYITGMHCHWTQLIF